MSDGFEEDEDFCEHDHGDFSTHGPLRWSFSVLLADLLVFASGVFDSASGFFGEQAQSVAATATHREKLKDRQTMIRDTTRDIRSLPTVTEHTED